MDPIVIDFSGFVVRYEDIRAIYPASEGPFATHVIAHFGNGPLTFGTALPYEPCRTLFERAHQRAARRGATAR